MCNTIIENFFQLNKWEVFLNKEIVIRYPFWDGWTILNWFHFILHKTISDYLSVRVKSENGPKTKEVKIEHVSKWEGLGYIHNHIYNSPWSNFSCKLLTILHIDCDKNSSLKKGVGTIWEELATKRGSLFSCRSSLKGNLSQKQGAKSWQRHK